MGRRHDIDGFRRARGRKRSGGEAEVAVSD